MILSELIGAKSQRISWILFVLLSVWSMQAKSSLLDELKRLQKAYPEYIKAYNEQYIIWNDGTKMPVQNSKPNKSIQEKLDSPSLADQLEQTDYTAGKPINISKFNPVDDPGRIRYEPFFRKMYGNSVNEVRSKLISICWMPKIFGKRCLIFVTTVNLVDKKLLRISDELEKLISLHPEYRKYLEDVGGTFNWRSIAGTNRLSAHSFGFTIDINPTYSNYWRWDLEKHGLPLKETTPLIYTNHIPWEIVLIFEKYGFIWGGKWHHYDTMHFEYRPELFDVSK